MSSDGALLNALATEARDVRTALDALATRAGGWVRALPEQAGPEAVRDLQAFDLLGQRLDALSAVLRGLSEGEPAADLIAAVPLSDMADRLAGRRSAPAVASGDLALFD